MFTKSNVDAIAKEVLAALKVVEDKHNIKIVRGTGRYTENHYDLKLKLSVIDTDGTVLTKEREQYPVYQTMHNLPNIDTEFMSNDTIMKITGFNSRSHKYPVTVVEVNGGKCWKFTIDQIKRAVAAYPVFKIKG